MSGSFHEHTRALFTNRPITETLDRISEETGLSKRWLSEFGTKDDLDPGVSRVQTLYEYLSKNKLQF